MAENQINYVQPTLTEPIVQSILKDGAPAEISNEFWDLMGPGLDTALLEEYEVKTLRKRIRVNIRNILFQYPESEWDRLSVTEVISPREPGQKPIIKKHKIYPDLEDKLINKISLVKGSRGKHGNLLEKLTTATSRVFNENFIRQDTPINMEQSGNNNLINKLTRGWRK